MKLKGTLHVESGESSINGRLLAIQGDPDPFGAATDFLANRNLFDGDPAEITGAEGTVGTRNVVFMTNAVPLAEEAEAALPMAAAAVGGAKSALKPGATKSAKKAGKKSAKRTGTKRSAKKTGKKSAKKIGAKKSAKKAGKKKSSRKVSTKKSAKKRTRKPTATKSAKKARRKK